MEEQITGNIEGSTTQLDFMSKYKDCDNWYGFLHKYMNTFKDYSGYLRISRDIFSKVDWLMHGIYHISLEQKATKKHRTFIFSLYVLLNEMSNYNAVPLSIGQIKELLGYGKDSDSIDYLIRDKGDLDAFGMTFTKSFGVRQNSRLNMGKAKSFKAKRLCREYKATSRLFAHGNFVTLNTEVLMYMLFHSKRIKVEGIYLYCYMLTKCKNDGKGNYTVTSISTEKIVHETGISRNTVAKYLDILQEHGLLDIGRGDLIYNDNKFEGKEVNTYLIQTKINPNCILN